MSRASSQQRSNPDQVLSHPLIVEAIEDEFVPVVVYNNQASGRDAELLSPRQRESLANAGRR